MPDKRGNDGNPEERKLLEQHGDPLSKSTQRAKWLHSPDERPDRKGQTLATRSIEVIRARAEERGGRPVVATRDRGGEARTLRMPFTEDGNSRLERVTRSEWFRTFRERDLVLIYRQQRRDGSRSNFFRLDSPRLEDG